MKLKSILKIVKDPIIRFNFLASKGFYDNMPDEEYLKRRFKLMLGYDLDLDNPRSFNEKIQWLKLYDRRPEYTVMVDKVKAKQYVAGIIGEEHIIPTLSVWNDPDEIDFNALPERFVLKCNHNSGSGVYICRDKSKLEISRVKAELRKGLRQNYYLHGREWPYKNVERRILAEQYMDDGNHELMDYKLMCFNGVVRCCFTCTERFSGNGLKVTFFDNDWNVMPFERHYPKSDKPIKKPVCYGQMIEFAEHLSHGIPFVRVDFYEINGVVYFGELTFYPGDGMEEFSPIEWDYKLGDWITLPEVNILG